MSDPIRKTRRAWNEPGQAHFLTYSCFQRLPLLTRPRSRKWVIDALATVRHEQDAAIFGYVVMPEHVHVLLYPRRPRYEMRTILAGLKRPVSDAAKAFLEAIGARAWLDRLTVRYPSRTVFRFWQPGGGFDDNVVRDRPIPRILEYIHANPVRRVPRFAQFRFPTFPRRPPPPRQSPGSDNRVSDPRAQKKNLDTFASSLETGFPMGS